MTKKRLTAVLPYLVFALIALSIFLQPFANTDELWNYNFARGIANGLRPYAEISMIQTPLSAYLSSLFLLVFGKGLFSFRIAGALLLMLTASVFYRLCVHAVQNTTLAFVATSFVFALHVRMWIYNYNYLTVLLVLWAMLLLQKDRDHGKLLAVMFGTLPLIKQNTGAFLLAGFYAICAIEFFVEKKGKKDLFIKVLLSILPTVLYVCYLLLSGTFLDFWEYAVMGIGQFTHRTSYFSLMFSNPLLFVFALFPWLVYGKTIYDWVKNGYDGKKVKCFILALATMSMAYPLCDTYHFCSALIPSVPLLLMTLKPQTLKRDSAAACNLVALLVLSYALLNSTADFQEYSFSQLKNYRGILFTDRVQERICEVDAYITAKTQEGYTVYIADETAVAYTIPLDVYTKNWDMLLVGNVGLNTVEDLTSTPGPCLYLVLRDESFLTKQAHFALLDYIKETYHFVGEVANFDVYEKN